MSLLDMYLAPATLAPADAEKLIVKPAARITRDHVLERTRGGRDMFDVLINMATNEANMAKDRIVAAKAVLEYILPKKATRVFTKGKVKVSGGVSIAGPTNLGHLSSDKLQEIIRIAEARDVTPSDGDPR